MGKSIKFKDNSGYVYPYPYLPVGSIYLSVNSTNPTNYFGGTWTQIAKGRTLVGVDTSDSDFSTVKKTGGSKYMQKHKHYVYQYVNNNKFAVLTGYNSDSGGAAIATLNNSNNVSNATYKQDTTRGIVTDDYAGDGDSGNLQPYFTCYIWLRTA